MAWTCAVTCSCTATGARTAGPSSSRPSVAILFGGPRPASACVGARSASTSPRSVSATWRSSCEHAERGRRTRRSRFRAEQRVRHRARAAGPHAEWGATRAHVRKVGDQHPPGPAGAGKPHVADQRHLLTLSAPTIWPRVLAAHLEDDMQQPHARATRRRFLGQAAVAAAGAAVAPGLLRLAHAQPAAPPAESADLVLVNANAITMDPARPAAQAVAIGAGRILAVGSEADVSAWVGGATIVR